MRVSLLILVVATAGCAHAFHRAVAGDDTSAEDATEEPVFGAGGELIIEYGRGASLPTNGDLHVRWAGDDFTLHGVQLNDHSFFPDNSPIPNAFIPHWVRGDTVEAVKAFTEPYYGARLFFFLRDHPNWGFGVEFIHFKVFVAHYPQRVRVTGQRAGERLNEVGRVKDYVSYFNVSHGVNHLSLALVYRLARVAGDGSRRFQPFVSVALGPAFPHVEFDLPGPDGEEVRMAYSHKSGIENFGLGLSLGARYLLTRHVGAYLEYKLTYSHLHDMHFDDGLDGEVGTSFADQHFQWGISVIL